MNFCEKVSIITVVYNGELTLEKTILSVLNQTYKNIEYIIIDGGSTDGTSNIIKKYENNIAYWVSEKDNGIYDAMNKGIKKSTGSIIGIINSDDFYHPYAVENALVLLSEGDNRIAHGDLIMINSKGIFKKLVKPQLKTVNFMKEMLFFHPTFFVRKKVYEEIGLFSDLYKIASDFDFFVRAKLANIKFIYSPDILVYMQDGGVSVQSPKLSYQENRDIAIFHNYPIYKAYFIYIRKVIRLLFSRTFLGDLKRNLNSMVEKNEFRMPEIKRYLDMN